MDWKDLSPVHYAQSQLQDMFLHVILPVILFFMAFGVVVFSRLPIVVRLLLAAVMVLIGLYLGGWLPW